MRRRAFVSFLPAVVLAMIAIALLPALNNSSAYAASNGAISQPHMLLKSTAQKAIPQASSQNMVYHGGPVMTGNVKVFLIFWQPAGHTFSTNYKSLLQRFFQDFGQTSVFGVIHQYTNSSGGNAQTIGFGGTFTDTRAYPTRGFVVDTDLRTEVRRVSSAQGWTVGLSSIFFVYTTADEKVCFDTTQSQCSTNVFCAYHDGFTRNGATFLYGSIPDEQGCGIPASPNHDVSADGSIDASSHEVMEAMSDALPNSGWANNQTGEIGDPCAHTYGPRDANGADVVANGNSYLIQPEWSNRVSGCSMS